MKLKLVCTALAATFVGTPVLAADDLPETYSFTVDLEGPTPMPSGTFTFIPGTLQTLPTLTSIDFRLGDTVFTTENTSFRVINEARLFVLGGILNSPLGIAAGTDDFALSFRRDTRIPVSFSYSQSGSTSVFSTSTNNNTISNPNIQLVRIAAAVPEPATWAMMIGGFGMVGGAMRSARRKRKVSVSYA